MLSGALPVPFPTISLHESFAHPTSMYLRNLMAVDTEEMVRAQPMDGVVLVRGSIIFNWLSLTLIKIGGCDKVRGFLRPMHVEACSFLIRRQCQHSSWAPSQQTYRASRSSPGPCSQAHTKDDVLGHVQTVEATGRTTGRA